MNILYSLILTIPIFLITCCSSKPKPVSLEEANRLYFQMKPEAAYDYYKTIWQDPKFDREDKVEAGRSLAKMSWLFYNQPDTAFKVIEELAEMDYEVDKAFRLWSRILIDTKEYDQGISKARSAMREVESESGIYQAKHSFAQAVLAKIRQKVRTGEFRDGVDKPAELEEAWAMMSQLLQDNPGDVSTSGLCLGLSLFLEDWPALVEAWLSYYRIDHPSNVHPTLLPAYNMLIEGSVQPGVEATPELVQSLILGLAESGFLEYASLTAKFYPDQFSKIGSSRVLDWLIYYDFLKSIEDLTHQFYVKSVTEDESESKYDNALEDAARDLWGKITWTGKKPKFDFDDFEKEVGKRFHTVYDLMDANDHYGLHMGQVVLDETRQIRQHGKQADLRYIVIDHALSNGYSSWFWDGLAEVGGWAREEYFLQVRGAYSHGPVLAWLSVSDSVEVKKKLDKINEQIISDEALAGEDPHAYLPGLASKLSFNANYRVYDSLQSAGLTQGDLRMTFINLYETRMRNSSIFAHEGRHAIDMLHFGKMNSAELEFRAKLSQVYFSEDPFLALNGILSPNIGDGTSHGKANLRFVKEIVSWMDNHKSDITDFDENRPALPQLDLLTPSQLKEAVKGMDPIAREL